MYMYTFIVPRPLLSKQHPRTHNVNIGPRLYMPRSELLHTTFAQVAMHRTQTLYIDIGSYYVPPRSILFKSGWKNMDGTVTYTSFPVLVIEGKLEYAPHPLCWWGYDSMGIYAFTGSYCLLLSGRSTFFLIHRH